MADVGKAYVQIVASAEGISGSIQQVLEPEANKAGDKTGGILTAKMGMVGKSMTKIGKGMTVGVTMPLVALGTVGVKSFAEVDQTMQLTNATMGNNAKKAQLLSDAMKDAAANSVFGMTDAATATLNFARAGLTAEQAASALAPAMNLAAGEGGNLDVVSAGLTATINGFGGTFDQASQYADVFANACNNSALDIDSLSGAMSVAAPVFSAAGYAVNDAALYMGVMANAGIDANTAANALKTGMARLVEPSKQGAEWMDRLGISMTNADGTMKSSVKVQKELHNAFAGLSESEQIAAASAIFGKNQMSNWLALIGASPDEVSELSAALEEEGTTASMAEAMMSGFGGSMEKLKSSLDVASTSLGEALAPAITKVAEGIQKAVDWFNNLSPAGQRVVAIAALIVAAIGPILMIGGMLVTAVGALGAAFTVILGPIALVVAALAGVIAVGVFLHNHWNEMAAKAKVLWADIKMAISTAITAAKTVVFNIVQSIYQKVVATFITVKTAVTNAWNGIKTAISTAITAAKTTVSNVINNIKTSVSNVFNSIKSTATTVWNGIKNAIIKPIEAAKTKVKSILDKIKGFFPLSIGKIFSNLKLPHISVSGGSPPFGIGGMGSLPKFSVSWYRKAYGTPYLFNSATVIPTLDGMKGFGDGPGGEIVYGRNQLMRDIAMAANGGTYTFNIYGAEGQSAREIAEEVRRILVQTENRRRAAWA